VNRDDIWRVMAIVDGMTDSEESTGEPDNGPVELYGGLTPMDPDYFDPVTEAHRAKRNRY